MNLILNVLSAYGSGNRCCYDKIGNLMYTNDTSSGSTPGNYWNSLVQFKSSTQMNCIRSFSFTWNGTL